MGKQVSTCRKMNFRRGHTFRRNPQYIPKERSLRIGSNNPDVETVCIEDNEYSNRVQYSIKKQKRWEMSEFLTNQDSHNDKTQGPSVTYLISQFQTNRDLKDISYYYESETNTEMGSKKVSNRKFMGKPKNLYSILKEKNQSNENINPKITNSQKLEKNRQAIEKISNQNFSSKHSLISDLNKELKIQYNQDKEAINQRECITITETVPINNPFFLKKGYNFHYSERSKRKKINKIDIEEDLDDIDILISEEEENTDGLCTSSPPRKAFVICENDLSIENKSLKEKKRKKKKLIIQKQTFNYNMENTTATDVDVKINKKSDTESDTEIGWEIVKKKRKRNKIIIPNKIPLTYDTNKEVIFENLHNISLKVKNSLFVKDMLAISERYRCWTSTTIPALILIDLTCDESILENNFIIIKPIIEMNNNNIKLKVIFNLKNFDKDIFSNKTFQSVEELIVLLQSTFVQKEDSKSTLKLLKLDKPFENLANIWQTTKRTESKPLFRLHSEWKNYEFDKDKFTETIDKIKKQNKKTKMNFKCENCLNNRFISDILSIKTCQHRLCESCLRNSLIKQINEKQVHLKCPINSCETVLDCATIISLVDLERYSERVEGLKEQVIEEQGCLCRKCGMVVMKDENFSFNSQDQFEYICSCGRINCGHCGEYHHWPASCNSMKNHHLQMVKLNDFKWPSRKTKALVIEGRICSLCNKFIDKQQTNVLKCDCWCTFCFRCGEFHVEQYTNCMNVIMERPIKITMPNYEYYFDPDSVKSKRYCQSLSVRQLSSPRNVLKLKQTLLKIDDKIKNCCSLDKDRESISIQYSTILRTVESIYVSLNDMNRNKRSSLHQILTMSAKNIMFYIYQAESIIDELNANFSTRKPNKFSTMEMINKRKKIEKYLDDAITYVAKLNILLR